MTVSDIYRSNAYIYRAFRNVLWDYKNLLLENCRTHIYETCTDRRNNSKNFFPVSCFSSWFTFLPLGDASVCSEKMAAPGEKSFCAMEYHTTKSVVTVQCAFCAKNAKDPPTDKTIWPRWPKGTDHCSSEEYRCAHVDACVARTWISYRCVPCHPWCTHRTSLVVKKKSFSVFLWLWTIPLR